MNTALGAGAVVTLDKVMFQVFVDSVEDISFLHNSPILFKGGAVVPDALRERIPPWRRGQFVNSAAWIREFGEQGKWAVPRGALEVSRQVLAAEAAYLDELQAASLAGIPWQGTFDARLETCVRCGERASWRFVLKPPPTMPVETSWRLTRPENAVPVCRRCVDTTNFERREDIKFDLAWGLWATRFEALHRWYLAVQYDWLPGEWDKEDYPLWPREFGGQDWKNGSGSVIDCQPRPPRGVKRQQAHFSASNRAMGVSSYRREKNGPYFSAIQLKSVVPNPNLEPGEYYCECGCIYRGTGTCGNCSRNRDGTPG